MPKFIIITDGDVGDTKDPAGQECNNHQVLYISEKARTRQAALLEFVEEDSDTYERWKGCDVKIYECEDNGRMYVL